MTNFSLEEIITSDNLIHQGMFTAPEKSGTKAVLWVHGLTGKFYGNVTLMNELAEQCTKLGMGFATFNTRGHDIIANFSTVDANNPAGGHAIIGAGYEVFEECVVDIDAAIGFLTAKGFTQVIVAGHSTGANKVCYYAAEKKDDQRVAGIVLAGPMSDRLSPLNDKETYEKNITMLKMLRDEGKGDALLTKANWFPATADRAWSLIAPNTTEDVFNYGDEKNALAVFSRIAKPTLVVLSGADELADRPVTEIQRIFDTAAKSKHYKSVIIPDTTHGYDGKQIEFVTTVTTWAAAL